MSKPKSLIAIFAISLLFANCKPKTATPEVSVVDSASVEKQEDSVSEKPNVVFFKALGTEPFWGIEISNDSIKFTSPEKENEIAFVYSKPKKAMDANVVSYEVKKDSLELKFTIQQGKCSDGMSDKVHNYTVKASLKRGTQDEILLNGCGNYIIDYRLHDIWALEELEGKKINPDDFKKGVPNLEIYAEEARFSGMAGCSQMGGKLFSEKDLLRFTDVFTTEMICDNDKTENILIKALQSTTRYELKNGRLYLFNPEGTKAIFRKVD